MIVMLPGFGRGATDLGVWRDRLPAPMEILDLPRLPSPTVAAFAKHFSQTIPSDALIVGESLGGLVALAMGGLGYRAVAFDPPLTTLKQWCVHQGVRRILARLEPDNWAHKLAAEVFGIMPDGGLEERDYYPLLDGLRAPAVIGSGDVPLWPKREAMACCIDDIDRAEIERRPLVTLHEIGGGHVLLDDNPGDCRRIILAADTRGKNR